RRNQQGFQNVLRPHVLQGVFRRAAERRFPYNELLLRWDVQAELLAFGSHIEDICPHHGGLPLHSDQGGTFHQNETLNVAVFLDNSGVNGPSSRFQIHRRVQSVDALAFGIEPGNQIGKRSFERRWRQLRWLDSCLPPHHARRGQQKCCRNRQPDQEPFCFTQMCSPQTPIGSI